MNLPLAVGNAVLKENRNPWNAPRIEGFALRALRGIVTPFPWWQRMHINSSLNSFQHIDFLCLF